MTSPVGQPLITLIERRDGQPSRLLVRPNAAVCRKGILEAVTRYGVALAKRARKMIRMKFAADHNDLLSYTPKRDKVVEGILYLLERTRQEGFPLNLDMTRTVMFLADKGHLDAFGRPVFFDNYVATSVGPMGVAATEMLHPKFEWATIGSEDAPWGVEANGDSYRVHAKRAPNLRRLSQSDVEALESALATVMELSAEQLRYFTHRQAAYAAAWEAGEGTRLDPRIIPDERDDELIDDLLYASRHAFNAPSRP